MKYFKTWFVALVTVVGIAFAVPAVSASTSASISGCVDKKTSVLRVTNKCKSTEKAIKWNIQGERGLQGSPGPVASSVPSVNQSKSLVVLDGNGQLVGYPVSIGIGASTQGNIGINFVSNSLLIYIPSLSKAVSLGLNGKPTSMSLSYTTTDCSGTPYEQWGDGGYSEFYPTENLNGTTNWYQSQAPLTTNLTIRSVSTYDGTCAARNITLNPADGDIVPYQRIAPVIPNFTGPLRLSVQ